MCSPALVKQPWGDHHFLLGKRGTVALSLCFDMPIDECGILRKGRLLNIIFPRENAIDEGRRSRVGARRAIAVIIF